MPGVIGIDPGLSGSICLLTNNLVSVHQCGRSLSVEKGFRIFIRWGLRSR